MDVYTGQSAQIKSGGIDGVLINIDEPLKVSGVLHIWALKHNTTYVLRYRNGNNLSLLLVPLKDSEAWLKSFLTDKNYELVGELPAVMSAIGNGHKVVE